MKSTREVTTIAIQDKVLRIIFKVSTGMTEHTAVNATHEAWAKFEEAIA